MTSKIKVLKKLEILKEKSPIRQSIYSFLNTWKASDWFFEIVDNLIIKLLAMSKDKQIEAFAAIQKRVINLEEDFDEDEFLKQLDGL